MSNYLFISDAAKEVKVESHVLRYWEEELHLPIKRNELGHRYYTEEDVERFKQIKNMKERGLQLKAIKMILKDGKLDVLSMEETGMDRTVKRNQAELGSETDMLDVEMEEASRYQTQSSMPEEDSMPGNSEMGISGQRMSQGRVSQPGNQEAGMSGQRISQSGSADSEMAGQEMPQGRMSQSKRSEAGISGQRMSHPIGSEAGISGQRMSHPIGSEAGMPGKRISQGKMSQPGNLDVEMIGQRGAQGRMEMGKSGQKMPQGRVPQAGIQKMRSSDVKSSKTEMPVRNNVDAFMPEENEGLAINIISTKEKEPVIQESREDKSRRLQWLLQQLIKQTLQENNIELCREIRDSVVKELDYQFRMQEEREDARDRMMEERNEEHYRRMDELIRKKSRRLRKMKPDKERQEKGGKDTKSYKAEERDKDNWEVSSAEKKAEGPDEWEQWSWSTDEINHKGEEIIEQGGKKRKRKEQNRKMQDIESQDNDFSQDQEPEIRKKKRRFF